MKTTKTEVFHYTIQATNTPERIFFDRKKTFRSCSIYPAKTAPMNAPATENDNDCFISKIADSNRRFNVKIPANPGAQGETAPFVHIVPDVLPEKPVWDLHVYGTAGDGILVEFETQNLDPDEQEQDVRATPVKLDLSNNFKSK